MWWGEEREEYPPLKMIPEMLTDEVYAMRDWPRPVHYTRYIESLLEFHHVPFTHREGLFNLIDYIHIDLKNNKPSLKAWKAFKRATRVDSLRVWTEENDSVVRSTFYIVRDDFPERKGTYYQIAFQFPCLCFVTMPEFKAGIFQVPIDDENSQTIFRWYEYQPLRKVLRARSLRKVMPWVSNWCGYYFQDKEDVDVIVTQKPKISDVGVSRLTAADEMTARYLSIRARLKKEAEQSMERKKRQRAELAVV
jgi:hypothetical protein